MDGAGDEYLLSDSIIYYWDLGDSFYSELGGARGTSGQGSETSTLSNNSCTECDVAIYVFT